MCCCQGGKPENLEVHRYRKDLGLGHAHCCKLFLTVSRSTNLSPTSLSDEGCMWRGALRSAVSVDTGPDDSEMKLQRPVRFKCRGFMGGNTKAIYITLRKYFSAAAESCRGSMCTNKKRYLGCWSGRNRLVS